MSEVLVVGERRRGGGGEKKMVGEKRMKIETADFKRMDKDWIDVEQSAGRQREREGESREIMNFRSWQRRTRM
jgi:3-dehydroquinate dehydratase